MKVLVLGIRGIPKVEGGIETHAEQLYQQLSAMGCDVEVLVRSPFVPKRQKFLGAIRLRRIWSPRRVGVETFVHTVLGLIYAGLVRPDVLHIHAVGPAIVTPLARLLGLRVVVTHHGPDYDREKWGTFARWMLRTGERVGMRYANSRIVISKVIQDLVRLKYGCDSVLIPNGVVPVKSRSETDHVDRFDLQPGRYFLQVSRIVPEKRQLDLIRAYAAARPRGWKLALVGGLAAEPYCREVEDAAKTAGVVLTGFLDGEALKQMYSHAGAFVLPSSHEGLPIVLLEALSYGLPVLASDIPANLEIGLEDSDYFPVGDVMALSNSLTRLSTAPQEKEARAMRMQNVAKTYDWNRIALLTMSVYRSVVTREV